MGRVGGRGRELGGRERVRVRGPVSRAPEGLEGRAEARWTRLGLLYEQVKYGADRTARPEVTRLQIGRVEGPVSRGPVVLEGRGRCGSTQALAVELPAKFRANRTGGSRATALGSAARSPREPGRGRGGKTGRAPGALAGRFCADFRGPYLGFPKA